MPQGFRCCSPHFSTVGSPSTYRCHYLNNLRACRAAVQNSTNIPPVLSPTSKSPQQWILLPPNIPHIQMSIFRSHPAHPITGKGHKAALVLWDSAGSTVLSAAAELQLAGKIAAHLPATGEDPGGRQPAMSLAGSLAGSTAPECKNHNSLIQWWCSGQISMGAGHSGAQKSSHHRDVLSYLQLGLLKSFALLLSITLSSASSLNPAQAEGCCKETAMWKDAGKQREQTQWLLFGSTPAAISYPSFSCAYCIILTKVSWFSVSES